MSQSTDNQQRVLALFRRVGPGHPPSRFEKELGLDRAALHEAVYSLNCMGLLDTDLEMGSLWLGDIE